MNYSKACELLLKNNHLLGGKYLGSTIDELILIPTDVELKNIFINIYLETMDGQKAIQSFVGTDVDIVAVFSKRKIELERVFFHINIFNLENDFTLITE